MRCTKCNEVIKPVVSVDIDGTLGMYHSHFLNFAETYLNLPHQFFRSTQLYTGGQPFRDWFVETTSTSVAVWRDIKLAYRQGAQKRSMPVYDGAAELCDAVRRAGAELWLCTTRPYLRLDNIDPDTREWLRRNGIEYEGLIYDDLKYSRLHDLVGEGRVVAVLDDLKEECKAAEREFGKSVVIMRRNGYNSQDRYHNVVGNLEHARDKIEDMVQEWLVRHQFDEMEIAHGHEDPPHRS